MKKEKHVSFRVDEDFFDQLEAWAKKEEIPVADFVRKLTRVSAGLYKKVGSLHALRKRYEEDSPRENPKSA